MDEVDGLDYEDVLLNGFEANELRRENESLRRQLETLRSALADRPQSGKPGISDMRKRAAEADRFERLYQITLQRCEILARKVKELGG